MLIDTYPSALDANIRMSACWSVGNNSGVMVSEPLTPESSELNNEDVFTIELSTLRKGNFALKIT
jgi:hypothetical protein